MAKDVSVVFKASDNLSNSIRQMRKSVDGLSKDVSEYRKIQDQAFNKKTEVKFEITQAKKDLKELERAVKQNVEGSEKAFKEKQKALEQLNEEYRRLSKVAKDASKAELKLQDDMHKTKNQRNTLAQGSGSTQKSILGALSGAGLASMLGGSLANMGGQMVSSMYGDIVGSAVSNIGGGIATGAAMGSIAGPIGTAIGAAIGGLSGTLTTLSEKQAKRDDLFKDEVRGLYDAVKQQQQASLSTGIGLSGKREKDMISYTTLLGSESNANRFLNDIQAFSAKTPFEMNNLLDTSKVLLSYKYTQDEIIPFMTKLGDASSALGIDAQNQSVVATALGRMKSSGKTSLEFINQLTDRAIPAIDYLADALGKTNEQIYSMISKGAIDGAKASKIIIDAMGKEFEGNMAKQSATYEGLVSSLSDMWAQMDQSMGVGYTEKRKEGMEREINALSGTMGEQMKEANRLIGEFQADLENKKQEAIISAIANAQKTTAFRKAEEENDGAEMGRIIAEARAKAENDYRNSEGYKLQQETDLQLVQGLQADTAINGGYMDFGRKMAEQFSKGYENAIQAAKASGMFDAPEVNASIQNNKGIAYRNYDGVNPNTKGSDTWFWDRNKDKTGGVNPYRNATGLDRVPFNNYPTYLHEGERILTKVQADKQDKSSNGITIGKLADSITVREEADIDKVVNQLYSKFKKHAVNTA